MDIPDDFEKFCVVFWNVNNKDLTDSVCALASSTGTDALVLNENSVSSGRTLAALQREVSSDFYIPGTRSEERFHCFCRSPRFDMSELHSSRRTSMRKCEIGSVGVLLILVHGLDIRNNDEQIRQQYVHLLARDVSSAKKLHNTNNLVLLGDFNMNPYDRPMNLAAGFNAMMTRKCVTPGYRTFQDERYDFYYNPMWGLFGDKNPGPAGTVYDISNQGPYGWSMIDQVLIHHSIVGLFNDVAIVTEAGTVSLMDENGRPDSKNRSDHFPIRVTFRWRKS